MYPNKKHLRIIGSVLLLLALFVAEQPPTVGTAQSNSGSTRIGFKAAHESLLQ